MSQNQAFMNTSEASALLKNKAALKALLTSPETRQLMNALSQRNGEQLSQAAKQAKSGDTSALRDMVSNLASTKEGAQLLGQLEHKLKG